MLNDGVIQKINKRIGRREIAQVAVIVALFRGGVAFVALVGRSFWLAAGDDDGRL